MQGPWCWNPSKLQSLKSNPLWASMGVWCVCGYMFLCSCIVPPLVWLCYSLEFPTRDFLRAWQPQQARWKQWFFPPPPSIILAFFVHYMSLQGAASSYLCPVAGYMCTEGTNLCGRRISTKKASYFTSVSLQASWGPLPVGNVTESFSPQ